MACLATNEAMASRTTNDLINKKRSRIDRIDQQLILLLNRRASVVDELKKLKIQMDLPIHAPLREKQIIQRLIRLNKGPLTGSEIKKLFTVIIHFFRERQRSSKKGLQKRR